MARDRPLRLGRKSHSLELGRWVLFWIAIWRLLTWLLRRCKPVIYHPIAWPGIALVDL